MINERIEECEEWRICNWNVVGLERIGSDGKFPQLEVMMIKRQDYMKEGRRGLRKNYWGDTD